MYAYFSVRQHYQELICRSPFENQIGGYGKEFYVTSVAYQPVFGENRGQEATTNLRSCASFTS